MSCKCVTPRGEVVVTNAIQKKQLTKKHMSDAGLDIVANEDTVLKPGERKLIKTDLFIAIPEGYVGLIWPRSGLAVKKGIDIGAGCIDSNYRGEVQVLVCNNGTEEFHIHSGDRIAQLLTLAANLSMYQPVETLRETDRGEEGFGSTGTKS